MRYSYFGIVICGIIITTIVSTFIISDILLNKMTVYGLTPTPGIMLYFNDSSFDRHLSNQFEIRQGQNMTLVINVVSDPPNIPVTVYTESYVGFTKTNGFSLKLSPTHITTPNITLLDISVGNNVTPNTYRTTIWTNTLAGGNVTFGAPLTIRVINSTSDTFSGSISPHRIIDNEYPLQQLRHGIASKDVTCGQNLQLIFKSENGSPACVKPETSIVLLERGWAKHIS